MDSVQIAESEGTIDQLILLVKDYSLFNRNDQFSWFLDNLNKPYVDLKITNDNIRVLQAISDDERIINNIYNNFPTDWPAIENIVHKSAIPSFDVSQGTQHYTLSGDTKLRIYACKYRVVISVDVSSSMGSLDPQLNRVLYSELYENLCLLLMTITQPIHVPRSNIQLTPEVYVTIIAQGNSTESFATLCQGALLSRDELPLFLEQIKVSMFRVEEKIIHTSSTSNNEADCAYQLQNAAFALKLLPRDATPMMIWLTDGVLALPENIHQYDSLLMLLNREDIASPVITIGSNAFYSPFGHIADTDSCRHLAQSTHAPSWSFTPLAPLRQHSSLPYVLATLSRALFGRVVSGTPAREDELSGGLLAPHDEQGPAVSAVITSLMSSLATSTESIANSNAPTATNTSLDAPYPWQTATSTPPPFFVTRARHYVLPALPTATTQPVPLPPQLSEALFTLLADARCREGFKVNSVQSTETETSVKFLLAWRPQVKVIYSLRAHKPTSTDTTSPIDIKIEVLSYYDFLLLFNSLQKAPSGLEKSQPSKLHAFLSVLTETDRLLAQLLSTLYTAIDVPALITSAQELALIRPRGNSIDANKNSATPTLTRALEQQKKFWKSLSILGGNPWHRWFKTERLELVLIHDSSLNKGTRHVLTSSSASNSVSNSNKSKFKVRSFESQGNLASSDKTTLITTSASSSTGSMNFTFKESLNALLDCLEHWSDVNHSRQLFVKFLHDKSTVAETEVNSSAHMSFCVARLSKESDNLMVVYIYFFAASPEHRAAIMHELRHTLEHAHCYGHKAIAVCKKPLRPLLVRYDLNQLRATHAQQHFGGTARPSRVMHRRSSTATTVKIGKLTRSGRSSIQLTTPHSEDSMRALEEEVSERDGESVPGESESETEHESTTTEEEDTLLNATTDELASSTSHASPSQSLQSSSAEHMQSSAASVQYDNKTAQLSDLIQLAPVFTLLTHYLAHHRWIWLVNAARTREGIVEAVVRTRLSEGFRIAHCDRGVTLFKEIYLRVSANSEPVPCIVQYVVFVTSSGFIVTELWMEPQRGVVQCSEGELNESDVFRRLKQLIYHVDHELVSSLFTFDRLLQILSKEDDKSAEDEREDDKYLHITKRSDVEIVRPVFSVDAVIEMSKRHTEKYAVVKPMFKPEQNDKVLRVTREIRSTLTYVLHSAVAIYSDCTVPGRVEETVAKYFVKGISQKEVLLVSIDDDQILNTATDDESQLTALQHDLTVEFCECSRTILEHTPPTASRAVREWLEHLSQRDNSTSMQSSTERVPSDDESEAQSTQSTASTRRLLSLGARQFGGAVRAEYRRGLVRTLYSVLRDESLSIGSSELDVMQWTARPYPSELDLTQCARLLSKTESAASSEALTHKFSSMFSRYFVSVHEGSGLFYFRPEHSAHTEEDAELTGEDFVVDAPVLQDDAHHLADNSPVPEIEDIWASESRKKTDSPSTPTKSANGALTAPSTSTDLLQAKTKLGSSSVYTVPLFMRLECVLHPMHGHSESDVVVPVTTIPTPHTVAELQQHAGHKILLRFVLITLPPQQLRKTGLDEERSALSALPSVHEEDNAHSASINEAVSLLPADIRHLLRDMHKSVHALLAEQVLQALRVQSETQQQLQRPTVDIVLHYMTHLTPPVLFNFTVPLLFVDARECRKLFPHELEHSALLPLHRLDDLFLLVHRDHEQRMHVPFWLILSYAGDVVKVRFQWCAELFADPASPYRRMLELEDGDHKSSLRMRVLNALRQRIRLIAKRVNQLFLLYQLHDTKVCSVLLEPEHDEEESDSTKSKRNSRSPRQSSDQSHESRQLSQLQNQQYTHTLYYPGQFSMPIVHVMALPLNERLQPSTAIKALINSTLHHFQVTNRRHMFVYRQQDGHTFYLRLLSYTGDLRDYEHRAYLDSSLLSETQSAPLTTPIPIPAADTGRVRAASVHVPSNATSAVNAQQSYLIVKVYGIDPPGSEITEQLHKLLDKKLHAITLSIISTLLGRNPQMKLTPADVQFLRPSDRAPQRQYHIALPTHLLADPYLYLLFLKQNLAKQHLHVMHFATAPSHETTLLLHQNNSFGLSCALLNQGPLSAALSSPPGPESASPLSPGMYDTPNLDSIGCVNTDSDGRCVIRIKEADFSFIYNNIAQSAATAVTASTALNTTSPLVATATGPPVFGQGVACIALDYAAVEDPDQVHAGPVSEHEWLQLPRLELQQESFTAESVTPISLLNPHLRLALNISLWARGSVEVQALIDHVTECANQALVEYALETSFKVNTVALAASEVSLSSGQTTPSSSPVPLTTHSVVRTEDESARARARLNMLQLAHNRQVPSVREIRTELTMPAWTVPYYLPEVLDIVRDLAPPLVTAVLFAHDDRALFQPLDMSRVKPASAHRTYSEQNKQLLFHKDRGTLVLIAVKPQSAIYDSVHNQHGHSEETSHSTESENNEQRYSTQRDLVYYHNVKISPLVTVHRHSFIYLTVQHSRVLQCYTYNINTQIAERLKSQLSRINEWTHLRSQLLSNVLHQKMGLFYHVPRATLESQSKTTTAAPGLNVQLTNENVELLMANPTPPRKSRGRKVALLRKSRDGAPSAPSPSVSSAATNSTNQSSLIIHTTRPAGPVSSSLSRSVAQNSYLSKTAFSRFKQPPHLAGTAQPNAPKTGQVPPTVPVTPVNVPSANVTPVSSMTSVSTPVTESSTCPFEILLKYHHPQHTIGAEHDPVLRHTTHARQIVPHLLRLQQRQHTIKQIYNNWGRRNAVRPNDKESSAANKSQHHSLRSQQEVENVIKFSRLVHCCRIPFLLARMPTEHKPTARSMDGESVTSEVKDQLVKPIFSTALTPHSELAHWQRGLLDRFLLDYEKYLESYGVHQLNTMGQSATENTALTSTENIKYPKVYMQRVFRGGLLLVVLGFRDFFVTCDLYFMHSLRTSAAGLYNLYLELEMQSVPSASGAKELSLITQQTELILNPKKLYRQLKMFSDECNKLKDHLHMNSFVYDYHLRQIQHFLLAAASTTKTPYPPLELVHMLQSLVRYHHTPPKYARNQILQHSFAIDLQELTVLSPLELFSFVADRAELYGVANLHEHGIKPAIYFSATTPNLVPHYMTLTAQLNNDEHPFIYTVIAFVVPPPVSEDKKKKQICLDVFIIRTNTNTIFPQLASSVGQVSSLLSNTATLNPNKSSADPGAAHTSQIMSELATSPGTQLQLNETIMQKALLKAKEQLVEVIQQAVMHSERDIMWNLLFGNQIGSPSLTAPQQGLTEAQFHSLMRLIYCRHIEELDPQLTELIRTPLPWLDLVPHLTVLYSPRVRQYRVGQLLHLFILNPEWPELTLHLVFGENSTFLEVFACRKELDLTQRAKKNESETEQISHLINSICHWTWRLLLPRQGSANNTSMVYNKK